MGLLDSFFAKSLKRDKKKIQAIEERYNGEESGSGGVSWRLVQEKLY